MLLLHYKKPKPYHLMFWFKNYYLKLVVVILLLIIFSWFYLAKNLLNKKNVIYQVSSGSNIYQNANKLEDLGYVYSSLYVVFLAKLFNLDYKLKSGYYELKPNMSVINLLQNFTFAKVATREVKFIEGKTLRNHYQKLNKNEALTSNGDFETTMNAIGIGVVKEGIFWPDTYKVNYGDSVASVLLRAHNIMQEKLATMWQDRQPNLPLKNVYEALILASLIEKETANNAEKAKISGVFTLRLRKNMLLQTDPSIIYALGDNYKGTFNKKDLKIKSPYNTYMFKGLPPTAISTVGYASLYAAMHPLEKDMLYFVSKKDGTHVFAKTYEEHKLNIKKIFTMR